MEKTTNPFYSRHFVALVQRSCTGWHRAVRMNMEGFLSVLNEDEEKEKNKVGSRMQSKRLHGESSLGNPRQKPLSALLEDIRSLLRILSANNAKDFI